MSVEVIPGRKYGLLTMADLAGHLNLSLFQTYRLVENPPPGFPPSLPRKKGEKYLFSSVLVDAWLKGADVSGGALPGTLNQVQSQTINKRGPGVTDRRNGARDVRHIGASFW